MKTTTAQANTEIDYVQIWTDLMPTELSAEIRQFVYAAIREANRLADEDGRDWDDSFDPSWCEDAVKAYHRLAAKTVESREIVITGAEARELVGWVVTYVRPTYGWAEVQVMNRRLSGCDHGCKLYVRKDSHGELVFQLMHSTVYGCQLGCDRDRRTVPVWVDTLG